MKFKITYNCHYSSTLHRKKNERIRLYSQSVPWFILFFFPKSYSLLMFRLCPKIGRWVIQRCKHNFTRQFVVSNDNYAFLMYHCLKVRHSFLSWKIWTIHSQQNVAWRHFHHSRRLTWIFGRKTTDVFFSFALVRYIEKYKMKLYQLENVKKNVSRGKYFSRSEGLMYSYICIHWYSPIDMYNYLNYMSLFNLPVSFIVWNCDLWQSIVAWISFLFFRSEKKSFRNVFGSKHSKWMKPLEIYSNRSFA